MPQNMSSTENGWEKVVKIIKIKKKLNVKKVSRLFFR